MSIPNEIWRHHLLSEFQAACRTPTHMYDREHMQNAFAMFKSPAREGAEFTLACLLVCVCGILMHIEVLSRHPDRAARIVQSYVVGPTKGTVEQRSRAECPVNADIRAMSRYPIACFLAACRARGNSRCFVVESAPEYPCPSVMAVLRPILGV